MKNTLAAVILLACAGTLLAQAPAEKPKPAAEKKPAAAAPAPAPAPAAVKAAPKPAAAAPAKAAPKPAPEEPEEAMVMIDDRAEPEGRRNYAADDDVVRVENKGIPSSYGQLKGVLNEGGRNILVFENPDSGDLSFVLITFGKTGVSWRLLDSLNRFGSEAVAGGMDSDFN